MARTPKVVEDRREQIMEAAVRVFSQKGFIRATNKDVAREAGITPGLIYYYFESKEALLRAILEKYSPIQLLHTTPSEMLELPPEDFMRFMLQRVLAIVEDDKFVGIIRVLLPELIHNPEVASIPISFLQRVTAFLGSYFEAQVARGTIRKVDVTITVQVLAGSIMGFILRRQIMRDPTALEYTHAQIADAIIDTVFAGLLPR